MSKRNKVVAIIITIIVFISIVAPKAMLFISGNNKSCNTKEKEFFILSKIDLDSLALCLKKNGIIDNPSSFISLGEYKKLSNKNIALGKYIIEPGTSYRTLLNGFSQNSNGNGNAELEVPVTFNNCRDINEMAGNVSKYILADSTKIVSYIQNSKILRKYKFTLDEVPTMFLPNTYNFFYDTDEKEFVKRMANEYKNFWTNERKLKIKKIGLKSSLEVVTLASIVYSEQSINSDEWPIIAGLYLNRIAKGIRLQSDPTFKFCWGNELKGVQRLLNKHRDIDCKYNTYKIDGLPPGPICLTSAKVIDAVLNRVKVDYIFMCAKPDYSYRHNFAVTGSEHMKNARIFQNWLANELKKKNKR